MRRCRVGVGLGSCSRRRARSPPAAIGAGPARRRRVVGRRFGAGSTGLGASAPGAVEDGCQPAGPRLADVANVGDGDRFVCHSPPDESTTPPCPCVSCGPSGGSSVRRVVSTSSPAVRSWRAPARDEGLRADHCRKRCGNRAADGDTAISLSPVCSGAGGMAPFASNHAGAGGMLPCLRAVATRMRPKRSDGVAGGTRVSADRMIVKPASTRMVRSWSNRRGVAQG